jgi:hypothetical protein
MMLTNVMFNIITFVNIITREENMSGVVPAHLCPVDRLAPQGAR